MRKLPLFFALFLSLLFTAKADYLIRGITIPNFSYRDLINYTLTFDNENNPIAAASMHSINATEPGRNSIVIIHKDFQPVSVFTVGFLYDPNPPIDIEVRDFRYDSGNDQYVLCGSIQYGLFSHAFIAIIDGNFSLMRFYEYPIADMFYSICFSYPNSSFPVFNDYYLCGKNGNYGVIASVNIGTLQLTNHLTTTTYHFNLPEGSYFVQDIGTFQLTGNSFRISVAGFKRELTHTVAWHGYTVGLSTSSNMMNNDYNGPFIGNYEHYKIRYNGGNEHTGGYFEGDDRMCALFGTPLSAADFCDNIYPSKETKYQPIPWGLLPLLPGFLPQATYASYGPTHDNMYHVPCSGKSDNSVPEMIMAAEDENEITIFYDYIIVKDTPTNISYQIYSITGQLLLTGVTTPNISTKQLNKGIYILRFENGKVLKFVK